MNALFLYPNNIQIKHVHDLDVSSIQILIQFIKIVNPLKLPFTQIIFHFLCFYTCLQSTQWECKKPSMFPCSFLEESEQFDNNIV